MPDSTAETPTQETTEASDSGAETADAKKKRTGPKRRKVTHGKKKKHTLSTTEQSCIKHF